MENECLVRLTNFHFKWPPKQLQQLVYPINSKLAKVAALSYEMKNE